MCRHKCYLVSLVLVTAGSREDALEKARTTPELTVDGRKVCCGDRVRQSTMRIGVDEATPVQRRDPDRLLLDLSLRPRVQCQSRTEDQGLNMLTRRLAVLKWSSNQRVIRTIYAQTISQM